MAQHVLDQRTDLERFFMDALDQVREYLQQERDDEKRAARVDYNKRIRAVKFLFAGAQNLYSHHFIISYHHITGHEIRSFPRSPIIPTTP